ncbi:DUF3331 domain-containing protein [Paraburkholderia azotifigens]
MTGVTELQAASPLERPTNSTSSSSERARSVLLRSSSRRVTKARIAGRCPFSRSVILEGDEVYRPVYTSVEPRNSQTMILASAVYRTVGRHAG